MTGSLRGAVLLDRADTKRITPRCQFDTRGLRCEKPAALVFQIDAEHGMRLVPFTGDTRGTGPCFCTQHGALFEKKAYRRLRRMTRLAGAAPTIKTKRRN